MKILKITGLEEIKNQKHKRERKNKKLLTTGKNYKTIMIVSQNKSMYRILVKRNKQKELHDELNEHD